ncbi:hypothetical protein F0562_002739 [Nyssa sinensis]|uniref:Uncharacterized protein n=1 Tax=Nyssa sinensis TaxID=561372 RepID=A0A5J5BY04_9ASTE|nr:hypothetical protein F0562_002739 [Nyssa sinensis]
MALPQINFNFPHFPPPPPSHLIPPPPPHPITPPPPHFIAPPPPPHFIPPPPPPSPDNHTIVIVIVFVSFGGLLFLAFLATALCGFIKKKKKKKTVQETDIVHVHEHLEVKEAIVPGPHGPQAVVLSITDDIHVDEEIKKNEKFEEADFHYIQMALPLINFNFPHIPPPPPSHSIPPPPPHPITPPPPHFIALLPPPHFIPPPPPPSPNNHTIVIVTYLFHLVVYSSLHSLPLLSIASSRRRRRRKRRYKKLISYTSMNT